jgi:hypothetical protein
MILGIRISLERRHHLHSPYEKSIIERTIHVRKKKGVTQEHVRNW